MEFCELILKSNGADDYRIYTPIFLYSRRRARRMKILEK